MGNNYFSSKERKAYFPVLIEQDQNDDLVLGLIESISLNIRSSKTETNFIIVPSGKEIEKRIEEQIKNSWEAAKKFVKKFLRKINPHHEVVISFDKRIGEYVGSSLGIALTISFIEELLLFYNAPTVVNINEGIAFTGSNDGQGNIFPTSKEVIEKKVEIIFYSEINTFVLPEKDREYALNKLNELQKEFPKRKLEIISVVSLTDLLNRRNLVDIKKQKLIIRTYKFSKKNWVSLSLVFLLLFVIVISGLIDFDTNPAILENEGFMLHVKNKNEKVLWSKKISYDYSDESHKAAINISQKIVDINDDGINEVILTSEDLRHTKNESDFNRVVCFNSKGELIWHYNFRDSILTKEGVPERRYQNFLIDTLTEKGMKVLYLFSTHNIIYPSAVYKLNLLNGERLKGTLWSQGHISSALINDFNKDGKKELVAAGINNGLERCFIFSINLNELNGQTPTTDKYYYANKKTAHFNKYVLLPKSDYNDYYKCRFNFLLRGTLIFHSDINKFIFTIYEGDPSYTNTIGSYRIDFDSNLENCGIIIGDDIHVKRDSLVVKRLLNPPYTNTKEFTDILSNQVRYWDGEKFVNK